MTVIDVEVTEPFPPSEEPPEGSPEDPPGPPRVVRRLAVLGDSTAVGVGDPLPRRGGWRGVGPLVAGALGVGGEGYFNPAFAGARMRCVLTRQLPGALAHRPDVVLVVAGMNDTLRPDFDARLVAADLGEVVRRLGAAGATVVPVRFHDHSKVFRLPASLKRALSTRVAELNAAVDEVVAREGVPCLDLALLPGAYDLAAWSVDRLHPSERGHRVLAAGFAGLLADAGFAVPEPVSLVCGGGATPSTAGHVGWLVLKGIPWLWRRGREFLPHAAVIMWRGRLTSSGWHRTSSSP